MIRATTEESMVYRVVNQNLKMFDIFLQHGIRILSDETNKWKKEPVWPLARGIVCPTLNPDQKKQRAPIWWSWVLLPRFSWDNTG